MYMNDQRLRLTPTCAIDRAVGGRIRAERWGRRWTCERLATRAGINPMHLRFVEWGWSRLSASEMVRVLAALDRRPSWLFQDLAED